MEFLKHFPVLTEPQVKTLFQHSREISYALRQDSSILFPEPLAQDGQTIRYQFIELPPPLIEQMQAQNSLEDDMRHIGCALALIHKGATTHDRTLLHGDFVPHNVFLQSGKIIIIDPHLPENLPFSEALLYGDRRRDVTAFIFGIFSDVGLKRALKHYRYYNHLARWFLSGYASACPVRPFLLPVLTYGKDVYVMKCKAHFSCMNSLAHCVGAGLATLCVIWSYQCRRKS